MSSNTTTYNSRKPDLVRTKSAFNLDNEVPSRPEGSEIGVVEGYDNRVTQIRQDQENYIELENTLYHIDKQVLKYIQHTITPSIYINDQVVQIPVIYAESEKYASIQRYGYIRDHSGKLQSPLIALKDTGISKDDEYNRLRVTKAYGNEISYVQQYNQQNTYDRFSVLQQQVPKRVFQSVVFPEVIICEYDLVIWTDLRSEMKEVVEQFMTYDGKAFGENGMGQPYITTIEGFNKEMTDGIGENKIVSYTLSLKTRGYVIPRHNREPRQHRNVSISKIVLKEETL